MYSYFYEVFGEGRIMSHDQKARVLSRLSDLFVVGSGAAILVFF